ncbi:Uncharacterised protein [Vibrio cholerae]|nr:Uncharacterised protein [Vibrio cholerae]
MLSSAQLLKFDVMINQPIEHIQLRFTWVLYLKQRLNTIRDSFINRLFTQHIAPTKLIRPVVNNSVTVQIQFVGDFAWRPCLQIEGSGGLSDFGRVCHECIIRRENTLIRLQKFRQFRI